MTTRGLLAIEGVGEALTGLFLLIFPSLVIRLLLAAEISGVAIPLARMAGIGIAALGVACWLARFDARTRAARGVVTAMVIFNVGAASVLALAGRGSQTVGIALWPGVMLHAAMAACCVWCLLPKSSGKSH